MPLMAQTYKKSNKTNINFPLIIKDPKNGRRY